MSPGKVVFKREGAVHLPQYLDLAAQQHLVRICLTLGASPAGFYQPVLRTGCRMRLRMMCLGWHWNARTYKYQKIRGDVDGYPVQALSSELADLASQIAEMAQMRLRPDIALVNYYGIDGGLGLHQDKDERPETLAAGVPVVSISLGDSAEFLFGGDKRHEPAEAIMLRSGDAFVFGGTARLSFHGVRRVLARTGPTQLGMAGRINITFRKY